MGEEKDIPSIVTYWAYDARHEDARPGQDYELLKSVSLAYIKAYNSSNGESKRLDDILSRLEKLIEIDEDVGNSLQNAAEMFGNSSKIIRDLNEKLKKN